MRNTSKTFRKQFNTLFEADETSDQMIKKITPDLNKLNQQDVRDFTDQELGDVGDDGYDDDDFEPVSDIDIDDLLSSAEPGKNPLMRYKDTDLPVYNYKSLGLYLEESYKTKQPLLIYGDPGLGKSAITRQFAESIADSKNRTFKYWNRCRADLKRKILSEPSKYFVLIDVRCAQIEPADIVGIPDIKSLKAYIESKQPIWIYLMSLVGSDGILFLDEINQGHEQVLNAMFEVVLDRSAGGTPFAKGWGIIGAGNLDEEHGNNALKPALTNRFSSGVLIADPESWLEWARKENLDRFIVSFVASNPEEILFSGALKPKNPSDPFPSPRQVAKLSRALAYLYDRFRRAKRDNRKLPVTVTEAMGNIAAQLCGVTWAQKFMNFVMYVQKVNLRAVKQQGAELEFQPIEQLYALKEFVYTKVARHYTEFKDGIPTTPESEEILEALVYMTAYLKPEWANIVWEDIKNRLMKSKPKVEKVANVLDKAGNPILDDKGNPKTYTVKAINPTLKEGFKNLAKALMIYYNALKTGNPERGIKQDEKMAKRLKSSLDLVSSTLRESQASN